MTLSSKELVASAEIGDMGADIHIWNLQYKKPLIIFKNTHINSIR
jgi:hypothetical protein